MNPYEKIPPGEIQFFKEQVQRWVVIDSQISEFPQISQRKLLDCSANDFRTSLSLTGW